MESHLAAQMVKYNLVLDLLGRRGGEGKTTITNYYRKQILKINGKYVHTHGFACLGPDPAINSVYERKCSPTLNTLLKPIQLCYTDLPKCKMGTLKSQVLNLFLFFIFLISF